MNELLEAIHTKAAATPGLMSFFPDGIFTLQAPDDQPNPYCVLVPVSYVPEFDTCLVPLVRSGVQFSVYADTDTQALAGIQAVKDAFEWAKFPSIPTAKLRRVNQQLMKEDAATWHAFIEYQVVFQEA